MPVLIISAEDYDKGREIGASVAEALSYKLLDRGLLDQVAREEQVDREDLVRALEDTPGFFTRRARQKKLLTCIEAACLDRLVEDDVVCLGLGAHLYVRGISHALKVRLITEPEKRIEDLAKANNLAPDKARKMLERIQQHERNWSLDAYDLDQTDPSLYDLVISLGAVEQDKAVEVIRDMVGYRKFQPMTYSRRCILDKALAARVHRELMDRFPEAQVEANDGTVVVQIQTLKKDQRKKQEQVRRLVGDIPGVRHLEVHMIRDFFGLAAQSSR